MYGVCLTTAVSEVCFSRVLFICVSLQYYVDGGVFEQSVVHVCFTAAVVRRCVSAECCSVVFHCSVRERCV